MYSNEMTLRIGGQTMALFTFVELYRHMLFMTCEKRHLVKFRNND